MKILDINGQGIKKYRVEGPHLALSSYGIKCDFIKEIDAGISEGLIFFHYSAASHEKTYYSLLGAKARGAKLIIDFDDYWEVPTYHHEYFNLKERKAAERAIDLAKKADLVICATKYLAQELRRFNKNVEVLPNGISGAEASFFRKKGDAEIKTIGWAGGFTHLRDLKLLRGIGINSKLKKYDVELVMGGFAMKTAGDVSHQIWLQCENAITDGYAGLSPDYVDFLKRSWRDEKWNSSANERYRREWALPIEKYLSLIDTFDICLAPLEYNKFNTFKSELKIIEAGFLKKNIIASDIRQYSDVLKNGRGFLVEEKRALKDFSKKIEIYLNEKNLAEEHRERLHEYCMENHELSKISKKRYDLYLSLFS
jgi:glycosyltransferase involved in cell wall biosynthesis